MTSVSRTQLHVDWSTQMLAAPWLDVFQPARYFLHMLFFSGSNFPTQL